MSEQKGGIGLGRANGNPELRVKGGQGGDNPQGRESERRNLHRENSKRSFFSRVVISTCNHRTSELGQ